MTIDPGVPLVVEHLTKSFRGTLRTRAWSAVADLSFTVASGRVLGIIGPNGSGKTTALRCALGHLKPTSGSIRVFGAAPLRDRSRRGIGFAPERFEPSPIRTGRQTLELLARSSGSAPTEAEQRANAALERFGLASAADRRVAGYSKGMRRRLAIAQALQHDPQLVILDEPFDGLDPLGVSLVREELAARARSGTAIVISSHQLADVEAVATDLLVVHHGRAVAQGTASEVLDRRGVQRLEVTGLTDAQWNELMTWVRAHGGSPIGPTPVRESLEQVFQRWVGRDNASSADEGRGESAP